MKADFDSLVPSPPNAAEGVSYKASVALVAPSKPKGMLKPDRIRRDFDPRDDKGSPFERPKRQLKEKK